MALQWRSRLLKRRRQDDFARSKRVQSCRYSNTFVAKKEKTDRCLLNLLEEEQPQSVGETLAAYEIRTIGLKE